MNAIPDDGMTIDVLLVEDSPGDVRLTQEALRSANPSVRLHVASDGVLQANCYFSKPVHLDEFEDLVKSINDFRLTKARLPQRARSR